MTLNRNPANFFAEVEQAAFHTGHLVQGIEVTDDPLMQTRMFSYLDTQLTRLGGPNFEQIPINRPTVAVNDNHRDGFHQDAVHVGRTPYLPNAVGGGCPFLATAEEGGYVHVERMVQGPKTRRRGPDDEYRQATLFWRSMTQTEQDHIADAFTFELGRVDVPAVVERMVMRLAFIDSELARRVSVGLGMPVLTDRATVAEDVEPSPALCMIDANVYPVDGRVIHILAADGADLTGIRALKDELLAASATPHVIGPRKGSILGNGRRTDELTVDRSFHTASSVEADAIVVAGGPALADQPAVIAYVQTAYRHFKTIAAWGNGVQVLTAAGIGADDPGVVIVDRFNKRFAGSLIESMGSHRHWERAAVHPTRSPQEALV